MPELPSSLREELRAFRAQVGAAPCARVLREAGAVARLLPWCRRALAASHLVTVAHALHRALGAGPDELAALRLPVDLLEQFPRWRVGSRAGFRPRGFGLRLAPAGAARPLGTLRLQLAPSTGTAPLALMLLRDLLRRLDPAVRLVVVADPGASPDGPGALVRALRNGHDGRVRVVSVRSATVFAQDNAKAARDAGGRGALLIPRGFRPDRGRAEEPLASGPAERRLGIRVVRSRLYWQGGNLVHDEARCLIGADTVADNVARLGLTEPEVVESFAAELGMEVVVLGDVARARFDAAEDRLAASGQASFHIDLDVALLGRLRPGEPPVALLADPARGLAALRHVLAHGALFARQVVPPARGRQLLAAAYRTAARARGARLRGYGATLERHGYRVVGVPDLRVEPKDQVLGGVNLDFSYCNVLPGLSRGRPAVYYLPWGIGGLDRAAEAALRAAGVAPVRASANPRIANGLMELSAGLRCFCGPLALGSEQHNGGSR